MIINWQPQRDPSRVGTLMIKEVLDKDKVFAIHDFLSGEECAALIRRSESLIYEPGTVADVVMQQVRNNE